MSSPEAVLVVEFALPDSDSINYDSESEIKALDSTFRRHLRRQTEPSLSR
jgi:hypothetical protein